MHVHDEQTISICVSCCIPWQAFVSINVYRRRASFTAVLTFSSSLFLSPFEQIEYSHSLGEGEEKNRSKYEVHTYSESFKKKRRKKKCVEENTIFQMNIGVMGAVRIWCAEKKKSVCRIYIVDIAHEPLPCYSCYFHAMPSPVAFVQTKRLEDWSHLCIFLQHTMHTTHTHEHMTWHTYIWRSPMAHYFLYVFVFFFSLFIWR